MPQGICLAIITFDHKDNLDYTMAKFFSHLYVYNTNLKALKDDRQSQK